MNGDSFLSIWPASASGSAVQTDHLILGFTVLTVLLVVPIFVGITIFAVRYRDGREVNRAYSDTRDRMLELGWMLIPFTLTLIFFVWGAQMFVVHRDPPGNATQIEAIGRQWMWKFRHPGGQAEINDLHVPTGEPIVINMISQDVIHSLYLPALRIQMETLPGRYTQLWFKADRPGRYHLFCSEYCGTDHSMMAGMLVVMTPADYAGWLSRNSQGGSEVQAGHALFVADGCSGCHQAGSSARAPSLIGLYGTQVALASGGSVTADATYLRDKILNPNNHKMAGGGAQLMPSYKGILSEDQLMQLIAYIRSDPAATAAGGSPPAAQAAYSPYTSDVSAKP